MRRRLLTFILVFATLAAATSATEFAVVVNPANPIKALSLADLGKILKGKTESWPSGRVITVVLPRPDSPGMKFLIEKTLSVGVEQGKDLLTDSSRKSNTIVFVPKDEDVVKAVAASPTAIGVVDVYSITSGVKVIRIDEKQPFDAGYALKGH
jgi:ABC-type phosphate transport system substrate-binding protein